jgi:predicted nucleic acid-binding protein
VTTVVDASVVVAALVDIGPAGTWAESVLVGGPLAAPHLLPAEVADILRRMGRTGDISPDPAALAHDDLLRLRVEHFPYRPLGVRIWELGHTVTAHDAWYVALAEELDAPLATLDARLARAPGPRCPILLPPAPR